MVGQPFLSLSLSKAEQLSLDRVLLARMLQEVLVGRKLWLHIVSKPLRDMGFGHGSPRPSDSEPAAGEPTCYFPIPMRLIFCGVAKALSLIVISPASEPLLCFAIWP